MSETETLNLQTYSYDSIKKGSISFAFASTIFGQTIRDRVVKLYAWCRYVDDQIDDETVALEARKDRLDTIARVSFGDQTPMNSPPAIAAFRNLSQEIALPHEHPAELLAGMRMDLDREQYRTLEELELYCYRVAGVVGLMMSHLMGVRDRKAFRHAIDLGNAMQLTNICRDVLTDARMGRIYVPEHYLREADLRCDVSLILQEESKNRLVVPVERLLRRADELYASGDRGLRYLPFRSALAVAIAREVYAAIGSEIRKKGPSAWDTRAYTSLPKKILLALKGMGRAALSRFQS